MRNMRENYKRDEKSSKGAKGQRDVQSSHSVKASQASLSALLKTGWFKVPTPGGKAQINEASTMCSVVVSKGTRFLPTVLFHNSRTTVNSLV